MRRTLFVLALLAAACRAPRPDGRRPPRPPPPRPRFLAADAPPPAPAEAGSVALEVIPSSGP
ncbi:MAG: hypothetical protein R3F43_10365 [bacterium]